MAEPTRIPRRDRIADLIREDIISGTLKTGERLPEESIAKKYGVSRVPVREALRRLESEGFVTLTEFQGARVSESSWRDSIELMQVRRGLEVLAARLAADARGGDQANALRDVLERGTEAARERRLDDLAKLRGEFHKLVAKAAGNRELEELIEWVLQRTSWGYELDHHERIDSSWLDHATITMAILNGSSAQAGFLMDEHIVKDEILYRKKWEEIREAGAATH
jgi:DNA-binding GntR family transcriptional regulator